MNFSVISDMVATQRDDDRLIACIRHLAKGFGLAAPQSLFSALALDEQGRLPFHQIESALDLIGVQGFPYHRKTVPIREDQLPAILKCTDDRALVLHEVRDRDGLIWVPGTSEPVWRSLDDIASDYAGEAVIVVASAQTIRADERKWDQLTRRHWFWQELRKVQSSFYPVLWSALLINLLGFALPLFTMNVYDRIIPNKAAASLWVLAIGVILAFALDFTLRLARANLLDEIGRKLDLRLSQKLFGKLLNIPLAERTGSTGGMARRVSDFEIVRDFFASTTIVLIVDMAFLVLFVGLIALIGGPLALVPVIAIAVMVAAGFFLQKKISEAALDAQADAGLQNALLVESISGTETLKSMGAEGVMMGRWRKIAQISSATQERLRKVSATAINLAMLCQQMTSICLVIGGFYLFNAGTISMGAIIAIVMLAGRSLSPAGQLAFLITRGRQAMNTLESLQRMMDAGDERTRGGATIIPTVRTGAVQIEKLRFKYPQSEAFALDGIDLTIAPGERVAIIGRVASGKSTLGRLICGLYEPESGAVMIDGMDSRQYHPRELRSNLRFMGQDSELFSGTIKDNLLLGAPSASDEELLEALRRVGADQYLSRDAGGFDRSTGEKGAKLSGGQRSFVLLARALASPCRLLFLDEPTGAMDIQTEKFFVDRVANAWPKDQSLVISTHRHAVFSIVDRIIVMDAGRIVADGPRDTIMASIPGKPARS